MADHRRIRRLREALHDAVRFGGESDPERVLAPVWQRLASLLAVHARAEEEICFLPMSGSGSGAAAGRIRDAICDHDDIREAVSEASLQRVGSAAWWRAVTAALTASAEHLEREEREILARCGLTQSQRLGLGRQWAGFVAALRQDVNPGPSGSSRVRRATSATASAHDAESAAGQGQRSLQIEEDPGYGYRRPADAPVIHVRGVAYKGTVEITTRRPERPALRR
jgi:Hemerythrin HHE cation binding domain